MCVCVCVGGHTRRVRRTGGTPLVPGARGRGGVYGGTVLLTRALPKVSATSRVIRGTQGVLAALARHAHPPRLSSLNGRGRVPSRALE